MQVVDRKHQLGVAVLRVGVGIIFLWAGLEKVIGVGGGWSAAGSSAAGPAEPWAGRSWPKRSKA